MDLITISIATAAVAGGLAKLVKPLFQVFKRQRRDRIKLSVTRPDGTVSELEIGGASISESDIEALLRILHDSRDEAQE